MLRTLLSPSKLPFQVLAIVGPPGSGKTSLLRLFGTECDAAGIAHSFIDARSMQPSTDSILRGLRGALKGSSMEARFVLVIDNYDVLYPLHAWLCEVFFPELPERVAVVVSSRQPVPELWRTDPAWRELVQVMNLDHLTEEESRTYLNLRSVPRDLHERLIAFSRGHPLALSLAADLYMQKPQATFDPIAMPGLTQALVRRFMGDVPNPIFRAALEACATVRVTTESVLAALLENEDVHAAFDWLCNLSFIDFYAVGIYPHDLVREVLISDLRWRDPDRLAELRRRALRYYTERLQHASHPPDEVLIEDYLFLHRDHAVFSPFLRQGSPGAILPAVEPALAADHPQMIALVRRWEGDVSARILSEWLRVQPDGAQVIRDVCGNVAAFLFIAELTTEHRGYIPDDPVVQGIWEYLERQHLPSPGGVVTVMRFVVNAHHHQSLSPEIGAFAVTLLQHCLAVQGLELTFTVLVHPERWEPFAAATGFFPRLGELHFEVSGQPVGVFMQDWRPQPPHRWLTRLAALRETVERPRAQDGTDGIAETNSAREQFLQDVRQALRHCHAWDLLATNRLINSKIVRQAAGENADIAGRVKALQKLIQKASSSLVPCRPANASTGRCTTHTWNPKAARSKRPSTWTYLSAHTAAICEQASMP